MRGSRHVTIGRLLAGVAVLISLQACSPGGPQPMAGNWPRVEQDMRWCLVDGQGVKGRGEMDYGLRQGSTQFMGAVENGFFDCQENNPSVKANFAACKREDEKRLYNIGRRILGLADI